MSNKVIKSISFNVTNQDDTAMLKHVKRRNFSGYVKKLILEDMKAKQKVQEAEIIPEVKKEIAEPTKAESPAERIERIKREAKAQELKNKPLNFIQPKH